LPFVQIIDFVNGQDALRLLDRNTLAVVTPVSWSPSTDASKYPYSRRAKLLDAGLPSFGSTKGTHRRDAAELLAVDGRARMCIHGRTSCSCSRSMSAQEGNSP
jgi:hypothetical protein